jgi:hypothetical protein
MHDPHSYSVGDEIYVSYRRGWNKYGAALYKVRRVTHSGQITASNDKHEIRITTRGQVAGQTGYRRDHVVSKEQALELAAEMRADSRWNAIRKSCEAVDQAASQQDEGALAKAITALVAVASVDRNPEGGDAHAAPFMSGAVPKADAKTPSPITPNGA